MLLQGVGSARLVRFAEDPRIPKAFCTGLTHAYNQKSANYVGSAEKASIPADTQVEISLALLPGMPDDTSSIS